METINRLDMDNTETAAIKELAQRIEQLEAIVKKLVRDIYEKDQP